MRFWDMGGIGCDSFILLCCVVLCRVVLCYYSAFLCTY